MSSALARSSLRFLCLALAAVALVVCAAPLAHAAAIAAPHLAQLVAAHPVVSAGSLLAATAPVVSQSSIFDGIIPAALAGREKRAFYAQLSLTPLAAGAALPAQLVADSNHDIVIHRIAYTARDSGTKAMLDRPPLFVELSLVSGIQFTPQGFPVELEGIAGINRGAPDLVIPIVIPAGETFNALVTNAGGANADIRIQLIGFRSARQSR